MSTNIEIDQQQIQIPISNDEVQPPSYDQLVGEPIIQVLQSNSSNNNLDSGVNNNSAPQSRQQPDITINVDDRFGQSCAPILSVAQIVNNIVETSIKLDRRRYLYLFIGCIPSFILMSASWITWAAMNGSSEWERTIKTIILCVPVLISTILTIVILLLTLYYGTKNYSNRDKYILLQSNVRHLIKLEGDQWIRYVEYLYGSNRKSFWHFGPIGAITFCCCRKFHYKDLIARGYGYIVLCQQGFILDEMGFVVRNKTHNILAVTYVIGMGLRVYLLRTDAKYSVYHYTLEAERQRIAEREFKRQLVTLDIYLPNIPQDVAVLLGLQIRYGL